MCLHGFSDSVYTFCSYFFFFWNWARPVLTACLLTKRCTNKECALESWRTAANPRPRHPLLIPTLTTSGWSSFCLYGAPYMRRNDCRMEANQRQSTWMPCLGKKEKKYTEEKFNKQNFTHTGPRCRRGAGCGNDEQLESYLLQIACQV